MKQSKNKQEPARVLGLDVHPDSFAGAILRRARPGDGASGGELDAG